MSKDKKNDVFLNSIGETTPLKKRKKETPKISLNKKIKTSKIVKGDPIFLEKYKEKNISKKQNVLMQNENKQTNKKLKKGRIQIDKKIDLHGLTIEEARAAFINSIEICFNQNKRCILYITGKGLKNLNPENHIQKLYYGKIRQNFKYWIKDEKVFNKILNVTSADQKHGGEGAFFVYLRKRKN